MTEALDEIESTWRQLSTDNNLPLLLVLLQLSVGTISDDSIVDTEAAFWTTGGEGCGREGMTHCALVLDRWEALLAIKDPACCRCEWWVSEDLAALWLPLSKGLEPAERGLLPFYKKLK